MTTITLEMPESRAEQLAQLGDRLPEILMVGLRDATPLPAHIYPRFLSYSRFIIFFLISYL
jgi:hypothetical protein